MIKDLKNKPASVHDRLNKLAKSQQRIFNELFYIYANERLLYRLSQSPHAAKFILKGAMAVLNLQLEKTRYTRDIDLLGFTEISIENIEQIFREVCVTEVEDDGLIFNPESVTGSSIKMHDDYPGVRVRFNVSLGEGKATRLQVDIGFGDKVYPTPKKLPYRGLLNLTEAMMRIYPTEAILAEKIQTIVKLDLLNSRLKDIYDIWLIASSQKIEGTVLAKAIKTTFEYRQTSFPETLIIFDQSFLTPKRITAWEAIGNKLPSVENLPELHVILDRVSLFLNPVLAALYKGKEFSLVWDPKEVWGWH